MLALAALGLNLRQGLGVLRAREVDVQLVLELVAAHLPHVLAVHLRPEDHAVRLVHLAIGNLLVEFPWAEGCVKGKSGPKEAIFGSNRPRSMRSSVENLCFPFKMFLGILGSEPLGSSRRTRRTWLSAQAHRQATSGAFEVELSPNALESMAGYLEL